MTANQKQIGGQHYKTSYQHWDLAIFLGLGFLEGCSTKHITRWRKKGGVQDLEKGLHYLDKLIEVYTIYDITRNESPEIIEREVEKFARANNLTEQEQRYIFLLSTYENPSDLYKARNQLKDIIRVAREELSIPGTPEDGGHHSESEK
jgi:hypothetical protein